MSKPIIQRWDQYARYVKIGHVTVSQSKSLDDLTVTEPADINWSAIGAVTPMEAAAFCDDLQTAIELCRVLDLSSPDTWAHPSRSIDSFLVGAIELFLPPRTKGK